MNERTLQTLFSRLVVLVLPLAAEAGCGGATSVEGGSGGQDSGSGGAATGGVGTGGTPATGGSATGGAATGGSASCVIPMSVICYQPRTGVIPRSCVTGTLTVAQCQAICGAVFNGGCQSTDETDSTITINCPPSCVAGRRPQGFVATATTGSGLGAYFARAAELECVSVAAFRGLRAELRALGAPRRLLRALSRAARDEQRHTRSTRALARRFGGRSTPARVTPTAQRSLEAIALENVAEGCVRELYGALVATFQARAARDVQVRSAMVRIAHEETRHAALSLTLQRWLEQRLDRQALARVAAARRFALHDLQRELSTQAETPHAKLAGLPNARQSRRLFDALWCAEG